MARNGNTAMVRQFAAANSMIRRKQVADALGLSIDQARSAIETLVSQGGLRRVSHGTYEFMEKRESPREAPIEDKIWRAMRVNPKFAASDISQLAGTTTSYFYKRLREYRAEGYVMQAGQRAVPGGAEKLWRLTMKGQRLIQRPAVVEFHPDALVVAAVRLNRLICTGAAMRFVDERQEAIKLSCEIAGMLEARAEE